ncbi:hypothetical protein HZ326_6800 [Fusarium oxysporum f. sp. albedinis]|nr:hypothetical protein HZ326_6800 [Fusarium oxysporum f. sp. albedinis]
MRSCSYWLSQGKRHPSVVSSADALIQPWARINLYENAISSPKCTHPRKCVCRYEPQRISKKQTINPCLPHVSCATLKPRPLATSTLCIFPCIASLHTILSSVT